MSLRSRTSPRLSETIEPKSTDVTSTSDESGSDVKIPGMTSDPCRSPTCVDTTGTP